MSRHPKHVEHTDTLGSRIADLVVTRTGSWGFIIGFLAVTLLWAAWNTVTRGPDPYPFILFTMLISVLAIVLASIILLSQNRQAEIDRAHNELQFQHVQDTHRMQTEQMELLAALLAGRD